MHCKKIRSGVYEYKNYRLVNFGNYSPDQCIWWEAVNLETGCADHHAHTKRELIQLINKDEEIIEGHNKTKASE